MPGIQAEPGAPFDRVYRRKPTERRPELNGRRCRILAKGSTMNAVLVEFENGERLICLSRALKKFRG